MALNLLKLINADEKELKSVLGEYVLKDGITSVTIFKDEKGNVEVHQSTDNLLHKLQETQHYLRQMEEINASLVNGLKTMKDLTDEEIIKQIRKLNN